MNRLAGAAIFIALLSLVAGCGRRQEAPRAAAEIPGFNEALERGSRAQAAFDLEEAANHYSQALDIALDAGDLGTEVQLRILIGRLEVDLHRYHEARSQLDTALQRVELLADDPGLRGAVLGYLGDVELYLGELDLAEIHLREAAQLLEPAGGADLAIVGTDLARTLRYLGDLAKMRGALGAAVERYTRSFEVLKRIGREASPEGVRLWTLRAGAYGQFGRHEAARRCLAEAIALYDRMEDAHPQQRSSTWVTIRYAQGLQARAEGRIREAADRLKEVTELDDSIVSSPEANFEHDNLLAELLRDLGEHEEAWRRVEAATTQARRTLGPKQWIVGNLLVTGARIREAMDLREESISLYRQALAVYDDVGDRSRGSDTRLSLARIYRGFRRLDEAEELAEELPDAADETVHALARSWYESFRSRLALDRGRLEEAEEKALSAVQLFDQIWARENDPSARAVLSLQSPDRTLAAVQLEASGERAFQTLERGSGRILREALAARRRGSSEPLPLAEIQARLMPDEAIIGWFEDEDPSSGLVHVWAYQVLPRGPVQWQSLGTWEGFEGPESDLWLALAWRKRLLRRELDDAERAARPERQLWDRRLEPLLPLPDEVRHLVLIPSFVMQGLPLEALVAPQKDRLLDRYEVTYAHSASLYADLRGTDARPASEGIRSALAVVDPIAGTDFERLSRGGALLEVLEPHLRDGLETLSGSGATEEAVAARLETPEPAAYDLIHVAAHGRADVRNPFHSRLFLTPGQGSARADGELPASDIAERWRIRANLVTLSACNSGTGRVVPGEGPLGLANAVLQAGAESVLASLWPVKEEQASHLMSCFYRLWLSSDPPISKATALRQAKQEMRAGGGECDIPRSTDPRHWSAFVLIGDPD